MWYRFDERVRDLLDFTVYLDISDEVKFAWKIQVSQSSVHASFKTYNARFGKPVIEEIWKGRLERTNICLLLPLTLYK